MQPNYSHLPRIQKITVDEEEHTINGVFANVEEMMKYDNNANFYNLNKNAEQILKDIVEKYQVKLIKTYDDYFKSSRTFTHFFTDLLTLSYLIEKLPNDFLELKEIDFDQKNLLHQRICAEIAYYFQCDDRKIQYEIKNKNGKIPDLKIDDVFTEIKTITKSIHDYPKIDDLYYIIKKRHQQALEQVGKNGFVVMAIGSQEINNLFYQNFKLDKNNIQGSMENSTMMMIEVGYPLDYTHFKCNSDFFSTLIGTTFASSFWNQSPPSQFPGMRTGFKTKFKSQGPNISIGMPVG